MGTSFRKSLDKRVNGGYTNISGRIFNEAILVLTVFPTEIFKHKKLEEPREVMIYIEIMKLDIKKGLLWFVRQK